MTVIDTLRRPTTVQRPPSDVLICVVGTAEVLDRSEDDLAVLGHVHRLDWRLDDEFGEPPPAVDWADGLIVLNADVWAAPTGCARLQALLKMAWRCGRTVALCGDAVHSLRALGLASGVPVPAQGLFLCPEGPCRETLSEFLDAVHDQPHRSR
jgi:hypothetical protein